MRFGKTVELGEVLTQRVSGLTCSVKEYYHCSFSEIGLESGFHYDEGRF